MAEHLDAGELAGAMIAGRYEVVSLLGRGGMASVYRARDTSLGRDVALKIFTLAATDQDFLKRETSEIRLLASLSHHALVTLFDASVDTTADEGAGHAYLVMELVEGTTLGERIGLGPIRESDVAHLVLDLAEAMHVVHDRGIVHRDIKPANILLSPSATPNREFRAKLSDFGIAYLVDSTRLTMPGTIIGTAAYLSPEQARGILPGAPADIYSLGLVTLEALTGTRSFEGSMIESLSARLVSDPVVPAELGAGWVSLLERMTAREPADRPSALEVAESARQIERDLYAASSAAREDATVPFPAELAATEAMPAPGAATEAMPAPGAATATRPFPASGATRQFPAAPTADATARLDAPTRVLPAAGSAVQTDVLRPGAAAASAPPPVAVVPKPRRTRVVLVVAAVLVALGLGAGVFAFVTATNGTAEETVEPLPEIGGTLGTHLDDLLESVTP